MFLLFPFSHENHSARRWLIVTLVIIGLCAGLYLLTTFGFAAERRAVAMAVADLEAFDASQGNLGLWCNASASPRADPGNGAGPAASGDRVRAELDRLCAAVLAAVDRLPAVVYGDVPARGGVLTLVTHQFLHGGWAHLLFNMWFLYLCGTNLEDRWGRALFLAFYLCAGVAGALVHRATTADPLVPMIGASGAIAGAMGAFLVILARTRISFVYALVISLSPRAGTFQAPAFVMLPLWGGSELLWALLTPSDGTAHMAHVGGFAFGLLVGAIFKATGLDAKLDDKHERATTTTQDPRILDAGALIDTHRLPEAFDALGALQRERPDDIDVWLESLRAATAARDAQRQGAAYLRLIELYLARGSAKTAADLMREVQMHRLLGALAGADLVCVGEAFARKGDVQSALLCLAHAYPRGLVDAGSVRAAVLHATLLARSEQMSEAERLLLAAPRSPHVTADVTERIEVQLARVRRLDARPAV